jgi:hypothetical protein
MFAARIQGFSGEIPRLAAHLLPDNAARVAANLKLYNGDINPVFAPSDVAALAGVSAPKTLYRLRAAAGTLWLAWDRDVNVVPGPIAGDTSGRIYYTGDGEPRVTNYALAGAGGGSDYPKQFYALGVPHPRAAPTLAPSGSGVAPNVTRAYVYTFVTQWGEESAPSDAATVTIQTGQGVALSGLSVAPPNSGDITALAYAGTQVTITTSAAHVNRVGDEITVAGVTTVTGVNGTWQLTAVDETAKTMTFTVTSPPTGTYNNAVDTGDTWSRRAPFNTSGMVKRIYRTNTGSEATEYQFVAEIPVANTTYTDTVADIALGETLPSEEWDMPPTDLHSIVVLPGGGLAGISGNELCFSVPYRPHAWPVAYRRTMAYRGVALGVFSNTAVVATEGHPYIANGTDPETISLTMAGVEYPCISKRGCVSLDFGVMFPSHVGLILVGVNGTEVVTRDLYSRDEWKAIRPETLFAAVHDGRYVAVRQDDLGNPLGFILDRSGGAAILVTLNLNCTALFSDLYAGELFYVNGSHVYQWDANKAARIASEWFSKRFVLPSPITLTAARVEADFTMDPAEVAARTAQRAAIIAANNMLLATDVGGSLNAETLGAGYEINGDGLETPPDLVVESLTFELWTDDRLIYSRTVDAGTGTFRMPSGYKADNFSVRILGSVRVHSVVVGENPTVLKAA